MKQQSRARWSLKHIYNQIARESHIIHANSYDYEFPEKPQLIISSDWNSCTVFRTFFLHLSKCFKKTDRHLRMYDRGFFGRGSSFEGARISRIMTHLHKAIFHITTLPLCWRESWRSLKNPHFPLQQRWLGWGLIFGFLRKVGKNGGIITMKGLRDPFPNHTFKAQFYCFFPSSSPLCKLRWLRC